MSIINEDLNFKIGLYGHAIAQALSCRPFTTETLVLSQADIRVVMVHKMTLGQVSCLVLRLPLYYTPSARCFLIYHESSTLCNLRDCQRR